MESGAPWRFLPSNPGKGMNRAPFKSTWPHQRVDAATVLQFDFARGAPSTVEFETFSEAQGGCAGGQVPVHIHAVLAICDCRQVQCSVHSKCAGSRSAVAGIPGATEVDPVAGRVQVERRRAERNRPRVDHANSVGTSVPVCGAFKAPELAMSPVFKSHSKEASLEAPCAGVSR